MFNSRKIIQKLANATRSITDAVFRAGSTDAPSNRCITEPLEDRLMFYNVGDGWGFENHLISYSYSNLLDGGLPGGITVANRRAAIEESLMAWAAFANISFFERADSGPMVGDGDYDAAGNPIMRFGHHDLDEEDGLDTLAHGKFPSDDGIGGDVHFDDSNVWNSDLLLEVGTHEIGHALGVQHANGDASDGECPDRKPAIMDACNGGDFNGLGTAFLYLDDIQAAQHLYGTGMGYVLDINGVLHVPGTTDTDVITIESVGNSVKVTSLHGSFTHTMAGLTGMVVHGRGGSDSITIKSLPAGLPTTVKGDAGLDSLHIGGGDYDSNVLSDVRFEGGADLDTLYVEDQTDGLGVDEYHINADRFTKGTGQQITWDKVALETVQLQASGNDDTIDVESTWSSGYSLWLYAGNGNDTLKLGNKDTDNIGKRVFISGENGFDTLTVSDENRSRLIDLRVSDDFIFVNTQLKFDPAKPFLAPTIDPAGERWIAREDSFEKIELTGNDSANTIAVTGTNASELVLHGKSGKDTFRLGNAGTSFSAALRDTNAWVYGDDAEDILIADDSASGANSVYDVFNDHIRSQVSGDIYYDAHMDKLRIVGPQQYSTSRFEVISTHAWVPVELEGGALADTFNVTGAGFDQYTLLNDVTVDGKGGADSVLWDDLISMMGKPLSVDVHSNYIRHPVGWLEFHGNLIHKNVEDVTVRMNNFGGQAQVWGTQAGVKTTILAGKGDNNIQLYPRDGAGNLDFNGRLDVYGQEGNDQINVNDQGATAGVNYLMTGGILTGMGSGSVNVNFGNGNEGLTINAGDGDDTVGNAEGLGANPTTTVNLGDGNDTVNIEVRLTPAVWNVHGGGGLEYLNVSDERNTQNPVNNWTISPTAITRSRVGFPGLSRTINYDGIYYAMVTGGQSTDTFNVTGTTPSMVMVLYGHNGADTLNIDYAGLQNNKGELIYLGYSGNDTMTIDLTADPDGSHFHVGQAWIGGYANDDLGGAVGFYSLSDVTINLGAGADEVYARANDYTNVTVNAGAPVGAPGDVLHLATAWAENPTYTPNADGSTSFDADNTAVFRYSGFDSVNADAVAPRVNYAQFNDNGNDSTIDLSFSEAMALPLSPGSLKLTNETTGEEVWGPTAVTWDPDTEIATFNFKQYNGAPMPSGHYKAQVAWTMTDVYGNYLGENYIFEFDYEAPVPPGPQPVVNNGDLEVQNAREISALTGDGITSILAGGKLTIAPDSAVSVQRDLTLAGAEGAWIGALDLNNNALVIKTGSEAEARQVLERVQNQLRQGRHQDPATGQGLWDGGAGILSSSANAANAAAGIELYGLAAIRVGDVTDLAGLSAMSSFRGVALDPDDVIIRYTYAGDANLDGVINSDDYTLIDLGYATGDSRYVGGDFNFDGVVNGDDYTILDLSYAVQGGALAAAPKPTALFSSTPIQLGGEAPQASPFDFGSVDVDLL